MNKNLTYTDLHWTPFPNLANSAIRLRFRRVLPIAPFFGMKGG